MTKTCSQCGAVQSVSVRICNFCDSPIPTERPFAGDFAATAAPEVCASRGLQTAAQREDSAAEPGDAGAATSAEASAWRGEVARRMDAYRSRRRRSARNAGQSQLPFEEGERWGACGAVALVETPGIAGGSHAAQNEFSFTLAIGPEAAREKRDSRMEIDVSLPLPEPKAKAARHDEQMPERYGLYPVASLDDRRFAALIDGICLIFGYGGFLALFSSLGGQFTLSKLSAEIYAVTLAIVYAQYFALFTIFGGTTPGMMFRGLQVTSFTGDPPTPRQMLLRSAGYVLSAGAFFLGFFWAWWDEDALTWHDQISRTYLSAPQAQADVESTAAAASHSR